MNQHDSVVSEKARQPVRYLVLGASLRAGSFNVRLARLAADVIAGQGGTVDYATMREFDCPSYDQALQDEKRFPTGAAAFRDRLEGADALVVSSPEYNASFPGFLKNAIDWVSRYRPQPFNERHVLLLSASPSLVGGNRGLWALRIPLEHLGARVYPGMFSLARAHEAFDQEGRIADAGLEERLDRTIIAFMDLVEAAKHYPCAKTKWIEFLSQRPDPALETG